MYKNFECGICESKFTTKWYLTSHLKKHRLDYEPPTSKPLVKSKKSFQAVEPQSQPSVEYKCSWTGCTKVCRSSRYLNQHVQQVHEGLTHGQTCRLCDANFVCRVKFKVHLSSHKLPNGQLRCGNCTAVFADYADTRNHLHAESIPFECHHCKYTSSHLVLLHRHLWTYHFRKEFKCRLCGKVLGKYLDYKRHMTKHQQATQNLQCDICLKKFLIKKSFEYHCSRWTNTFPCTKCDVRCHTPGKLETHMEQKHNEFFPCHICNQPFRK
jgi:Zinc finger, C2H2 type